MASVADGVGHRSACNDRRALMDLPKIKDVTAKERAWFAANRDEAIALVCTSLAVGLVIGALIGHLIK